MGNGKLSALRYLNLNIKICTKNLLWEVFYWAKFMDPKAYKALTEKQAPKTKPRTKPLPKCEDAPR